jgi:sialate O-acetylesterase
MIAPVTSYSVAGVIWYQGESNTAAPQNYAQLFTTMIGSWRKAWNKSFPFYYVQIAPFTYGTKNSGNLVREQQARSMSLENTGMVVISDIAGDTTDIHPKNKHDVGLRLANWALAETYHKNGIAYKNPMYKDMEVKGNKIVVNIINAPDGLEAKGTTVHELSVAGADKVFYPAEARVEGSRLIVSSKQVKQPVAVRYQFSNAGVGNIFSKSGFPLAPFRTDDWEVGQ